MRHVTNATEAWLTAENKQVEFMSVYWVAQSAYTFSLTFFMAFFTIGSSVNKCLPFSICESTGLEVWMNRSGGEKGEEAFPGAVPRTMSGLSGPSTWTLSFSELAARPGTYPSPSASKLSSPGELSICAKFIRHPSVFVAIMAAPSCCSSKSAYGLWGPGAGAVEAFECS